MRFFSLLLLALVPSLDAMAREPFDLAGHRTAPGTASSFIVRVAEMDLPITVVHGATEGPVLTLTAGIHGDEFPSILALQRLRTELTPATLRGTVVLVHLANTAGFHARRIAVAPSDGKNLNRIFPGKADGTPTEQVADFLTREVVARVDHLVDLHSGSWNQRLWPHVYAPFVGDAALDARTLEFAKSTGMRHIVLYGDRPRDPANSISYPNTAMTRGKPGLTVEIGHLGERGGEWVDEVLGVCRNLLRHLRMIPGEAPAPAGFTLYRTLHEVESPATGLFTPRARIGEWVEAGAVVGEVSDYFGNVVATLRAPLRGVILMINETPPVRAGEHPVTVGEPVAPATALPR
jgi:uncharacterized protein